MSKSDAESLHGVCLSRQHKGSRELEQKYFFWKSISRHNALCQVGVGQVWIPNKALYQLSYYGLWYFVSHYIHSSFIHKFKLRAFRDLSTSRDWKKFYFCQIIFLLYQAVVCSFLCVFRGNRIYKILCSALKWHRNQQY